MAPHTTGCERSFAQTSGFGEQARSPHQQPKPSSAKKPVAGKEIQQPKAGTTTASSQSIPSGSASNDQKARRWAKHQDYYQKFLAEAEQRRLKRKDLEARNKMWQQAAEKSQTRLDALEEEREQILQKMNTMEAAKERYNAANGIDVSENGDKETRAKWEAYFALESDELEV